MAGSEAATTSESEPGATSRSGAAGSGAAIAASSTAIDPIAGRNSDAGRATITPVTLVAATARRPRRSTRPGSRRSPTAPRSDRSRGRPRQPGRTARCRRGPAPHAPITPDPPIPITYGRPTGARQAVAPARPRLPRARSASGADARPRQARASSRTPGPGGSTGGPDRTSSTASPAFAPAAAVSRQWFDHRRPLVISVSPPSASAVPTRYSRFRSLLPPNASGRRSSRLTQTSTRRPAPPRTVAADASGDGPSNRRNRAVGGGRHRPMVAAYHRPMATRVSPAERPTTIGQHAGMERSIAISRRRSARSSCTRRSCRPRRATRPASTTTATARPRSTSSRASARYTWGPTGLEHEMTARPATSSTSRPARSTSRRTLRRPNRWSSC